MRSLKVWQAIFFLLVSVDWNGLINICRIFKSRIINLIFLAIKYVIDLRAAQASLIIYDSDLFFLAMFVRE